MPLALRPMPLAYFLTFTCYGNWLHGREPGSVDSAHNQYGEDFLRPDAAHEERVRARMKESPFTLDAARRKVVRETVREVTAHRRWRLIAAHVRATHIHVILQGDCDPDKMLNDRKAYATRNLKRAGYDLERKRRWTEGGSMRFLWKTEHLLNAVRYVIEDQGEPMEIFVSPENLQSP